LVYRQALIVGELFTFGAGVLGKLGHGGNQDELAPTQQHEPRKGNSSPLGVETLGSWATECKEDELGPRLVEALAGKKVVGVSAGDCHTAAWTAEGELFTFGYGRFGRLGHGGEETELVPRLVEVLAGKKVIMIGATHGQLGHGGAHGHRGGEQNELVPRLVKALTRNEGGWCDGRGVSHTGVDRGGGVLHLWRWILWAAGPRRVPA
jgi:hypothetical protein